jgi:hypothetical protein
MIDMIVSATYICPVRGLAGLEPPDPARLTQAAKVANNPGVERLLLPVLEEALSGGARAKIRYLEGLISALDQVADAGMTAWFIAPAQQILGLAFVPQHLVKGDHDLKAG